MLIIAIWVTVHAVTSYMEIELPAIGQFITSEKRLVNKDCQFFKDQAKKELVS